MIRYKIKTLPYGGYEPQRSKSGEFVKFNDVAEILDELEATKAALAHAKTLINKPAGEVVEFETPRRLAV